MSHMSEKRLAVQFDVTLERIQVQERIDAADDSARLNQAQERLVAALTEDCP